MKEIKFLKDVPTEPSALIEKIKELDMLLTISNDAKKTYEKEISLLNKLKPQPGDQEYLLFCTEELERINDNIFKFYTHLCACKKQLDALKSSENEGSQTQKGNE